MVIQVKSYHFIEGRWHNRPSVYLKDKEISTTGEDCDLNATQRNYSVANFNILGLGVLTLFSWRLLGIHLDFPIMVRIGFDVSLEQPSEN